MKEFSSSHLQKRNKLLLNHLVEAAANLLFRCCPPPSDTGPQLFTTLRCVRREYICIVVDPPPVKSSPMAAGLTSYWMQVSFCGSFKDASVEWL